MKNRFIVPLIIFTTFPTFCVFSQIYRTGHTVTYELGLTLGTNLFLGDLGGTNQIGQGRWKDAEWQLMRPVLGLYGKWNAHKNFRVRLETNFTTLKGADIYAEAVPGDAGFFRQYRNLSFRSPLFETVLGLEVVPKSIRISSRIELEPSVVLGAGLLYFNPQAKLDGEWIGLQPLGTEGQGLPEYPDRKRYKLLQPMIPLSLGLGTVIDERWRLTFDLSSRFTFTDYLDDVSKTYVDPQLYFRHYESSVANTIMLLANRSPEIDPDGQYSFITEPGQQRGNPNNNDHYFLFTVRFGILLGTNHNWYDTERKIWRRSR